MTPFADISQVYQYLEELPSFQIHGAKAARPGLERITSICNVMGNPQKNLGCIHIAGTNGKGSTGAMLAYVYENAGFQCGFYSSPHLESVRERVRINRELIPEKEMLRFFRTWGEYFDSLKLSYFEITTAMAFWWFSEAKTDIVILETGLGGRLDATNIVDPLLSVITSVSHDHQEFLGRTLKKIAAEKGGIIKPGRPVVIGNMATEARNVISETAERNGSELWDVRGMHPRFVCSNETENRVYFRDEHQKITLSTDISSPVQRWNMAAAWKVTRCLNDRYPVSESVFCDSMKYVSQNGIMPGRFERLAPDLCWYFDGAHNPEAVKTLLDTINVQDWRQEPVMVLSLMKDKAQKKMLIPFSVFKKNYYYTLNTERAAEISQISPFISNLKCLPPFEEEIINFFQGLTKDVVIFTGSFYFYCVVKRWVSRIIKAD